VTAMLNTRVVLNARPRGVPVPEDFRVEQAPIPEPAEGEVLLRNIYLSLDPYIRGRIGDGVLGRGRPKVPLGGVIEGGTVAAVVDSCHPDFQRGDIVLSAIGWQQYGVQQAGLLHRIDPDSAPISTFLGILGMPGFTAYAGLNLIGRPQPGETVVVAAATGPVGSMVGQLARIAGAHVVGIAGGSAKVDWLKQAGFDEAVDHRSEHFEVELARATPRGIDVYFENVGGVVFDAVFPRLNPHARVPVCGLAAHYNDVPGDENGAPLQSAGAAVLLPDILSKFLQIRGFAYTEFVDCHEDEFRSRAAQWLAEGRLSYVEDVEAGIENAPSAFIKLITGRNFGKSLVAVSPDPTQE